jgi:glyoxylase-like metal-dependent hydrolase (beta-lactamase superfamily II)
MNIFTIAGQGYDSNIFVVLGKVPSIVDTGTGLNTASVVQVLKRFIDPREVKQVVLTHEHYDHVGGIEALLKECDKGVQVIAHQATSDKLHDGHSSFAEMLGGRLPRVKIDLLVDEGDTVMLGDAEVVVMATPGHSRGSICLFESEKKVLFSGDTVFAQGDFGRFDLPGGDYMSLRTSLERIGSLGVGRLYPGHGPVVETEANRHIEKSVYNIAAYS